MSNPWADFNARDRDTDANLDESTRKLREDQLPDSVEKTADLGTTGHAADHSATQTALAAKAPLDSPSLIGSPTAPTQPASDKSTKLGTTAFSEPRREGRNIFDAVAALGASGDGRQVTVSITGTAVTGSGFSSADNGKVLVCPDAGTGGRPHVATVTYNSSTSLTLSSAAPTNVSSKKATLGTDCSTQLAAAATALAARRRLPAYDPYGGSDYGAAFKLEIPPGIYIVTQPGALLTLAADTYTNGCVVQGAGRETTTIYFAPTTASQALISNTRALYNLAFSDLTFACSDQTATFLASVGDHAQRYTFERVDWTGSWLYGVRLTGTNNNSEMRWEQCGIYGAFFGGFLTSPAVGSGGSDQFVNYDFSGCDVIMPRGNFVDMASGGSINVFGGNLIHLASGAPEGQIFFALRGSSHGYGACRLLVEGVRVEHRHARSKLVYSEWGDGLVRCHQYDGVATSAVPITTAKTTTLGAGAAAGDTSLVVASSASFAVGNVVTLGSGGTKEQVYVSAIPDSTHLTVTPLAFAQSNGSAVTEAVRADIQSAHFRNPNDLMLQFENCRLVGQHVYEWAESTFNYRRQPSYRGSQLYDYTTAAAFVVDRPYAGAGNLGNKIPIAFDDCKGSGGNGNAGRVIDCVVNGLTAPGAQLKRRTASFKTYAGGLPWSGSPTTTITIPASAIITRIRAYKPAANGTSTATNWTYTVSDGSNGGATIGSVITPGNGGVPAARQWKDGFAFDSGELFVPMTGSGADWTLTLTSGVIDQNTSQCLCIVEYLA